MNEKAKIIRKPDLAKAIYDLLKEFGLDRARPRTGKAHKIVNIILNTIVEGLRRGEDVKIQGFGTFYLHTLPPRLKKVIYFRGTRKPWNPSENPTAYITLPTRHVIRFKPSESISREPNHTL